MNVVVCVEKVTSVVDFVCACVREILAFEPYLSATNVLAQPVCKCKGSRAPHIIIVGPDFFVELWVILLHKGYV